MLAGCVQHYPYVAAVYQDGSQLYVKTCDVAVNGGGRVSNMGMGCHIEPVDALPVGPLPQAARRNVALDGSAATAHERD
jgi:hypothetical protein